MPKVIDTDRLFRTTTLLFAERGYVATTTLEIAKRAGVNEVTLFRRYKNKANLISAALTHCLAVSPFVKRIHDACSGFKLVITLGYLRLRL